MVDSLEPVPGAAGLWRAPGAPSASPGAHAIVVGISDYPFLAGGSEADRVPDSHGLLQLQVSAKTAARVFAWLRARGSVAGRPILSCRLLLAPQKGTEVTFVDEQTRGHYAIPDFETLRSAILDWGFEFLQPDTNSGTPDRASFFFFSGHGLEHHSAPVILTRDYLEPVGNSGYSKAIAIRELRDAIRTYNVSAAYYFLDACRNSAPELQRRTRNGQSILVTEPDPVVFPDPNAWIQATAPGQLAYQKNDPEAPATFFGQALIEGLEGHGPTYRPYDLALDPCSLKFGELDGFVKERTRELLKEINPQLTQSAKAGGDPYEESAVLSVVPRSLFAPAAPPPPPPPPPPRTSVGNRNLRDLLGGTAGFQVDFSGIGDRDFFEHHRPPLPPPLPAPQPRPPAVPPSASELLETRVAKADAAMEREHAIGALVEDIGLDDLGKVLRHEWLSYPWFESFRVGMEGTKSPASSVRVETMRVTETSAMVCVWADLLVIRNDYDEAPLWLLLGSPEGEWAPKGVIIPYDQSPVPARLEAVFGRPHPERAELIQLSARIGPPDLFGNDNGPVREHWEQLWKAQQSEAFLHVAAARESLKPFVEGAAGAMMRKGMSRTAAALGAALMLQCGADKQLRNWPKGLSDMYNSPDGAALWAETLFRRGAAPGSPAWKEAMKYFGRAGRALPQLTPTLEMAIARADWLRAPRYAPHLTADVEVAASRLEDVALRLQPSGRFASFDAPDQKLASFFS